jgi:hypothetical protein
MHNFFQISSRLKINLQKSIKLFVKVNKIHFKFPVFPPFLIMLHYRAIFLKAFYLKAFYVFFIISANKSNDLKPKTCRRVNFQRK